MTEQAEQLSIPPSVLVVDDDPGINRLLQVRLRNLGYTVASATNGEEALAAVEADQPDLMLLDVSMPGIGGMEVLHDIRSRKLDIAVIMTTAFGSELVAIEALRNGANDYLRKPFESEEFRAVVTRTANQQQLERQNQLLRRQLDAELRRASEIQSRLLPRVPPRIPGFDIAARCLPAREVGGDFYDWQSHPDGTVSLTLGDVMGKGMPAALLMATVRAALRTAAPDHSPAATLDTVKRALTSDLDGTGAFVTLFHAVLHPAQGELRFADAGHGLAVLLTAAGDVQPLGLTGLPMGIDDAATSSGGCVVPAPGDAIVICSDGIVESIPDLETALAPLKNTAAADRRSAGGILAQVFRVAQGQGTAGDDRTALVIRREEQ
jgi:serine phosphatase RsbU (regulator of sigma subunit)